ncbi:MAG: nuclease-related domain-containing protein [Acidimicrobiales bacterium]
MLTFAPPTVGIVLVTNTGGIARWVILGMCITFGPSLAAAFLIGASGVTNEAMGLAAEGMTADEFRTRRRGWNLLNGLTLRPYQLDHVAVSAAGVLVIETKWSMSSWSGKDTYNRNARKRAVSQATTGKHHVAYLLDHLVAASDVTSLVVLWSPAGVEEQIDGVKSQDGCAVVLGRDLSSWLDDFEASSASRIDPGPVWDALRRVAAEGDEIDRERGLMARPSLAALYLTKIAGPVLAIMGSICTFAAGGGVGLPAAFGVEAVIALGLAMVARRRNEFRLTFLAWFSTSVGLLFLLVVGAAVTALYGT